MGDYYGHMKTIVSLKITSSAKERIARFRAFRKTVISSHATKIPSHQEAPE
jgi:hypothetical protein